MRESTGGFRVSAIVAAATTLLFGTIFGATNALAGSAPDVNADTIGCYDQANGAAGAVWYLSATNDPGTAAPVDPWTEFGPTSGVTSVTGKFGGGNVTGLGIWQDNGASGVFAWTDSSASSATDGFSVFAINEGVAASTRPVGLAGNFLGNGNPGFALYYPDVGVFVIDTNPGTATAVPAFEYGPKDAANIVPLVGDWNGDGSDTVGVWDRVHSRFFLTNVIQDTDPANPPDELAAATVTFTFGPGNDNWIPVVGDWDLQGGDSVGLFDPDTGTFRLRNTNGDDVGGTKADLIVTGYGDANCTPVAGNWNNGQLP